MPSVWVTRRQVKTGIRYRVLYRLGGRESVPRYAGAFKSMREARIRRDWVAGEIAAMRVPELGTLAAPEPAPTLAEAATRWQSSRVDVAEATPGYSTARRCGRCSRSSALVALTTSRPPTSPTSSPSWPRRARRRGSAR